MPKENRNFEIKYNNTGVEDLCAVCGNENSPPIPLAIFAMGTWESICGYCAEKYAPEMHDALHLFYANGGADKFLKRAGFQKKGKCIESRMKPRKKHGKSQKRGARR